MTRGPVADPLSAVIERTTATLTQARGESAATWRFVRSWLLINRYDHGGAAMADLDESYQDFQRLPEETPGRARLAAAIVGAQLRHGVLSREDLFERNRRLADIAGREPDPPADWRATAAVVRAYELHFAGVNATPGFDLAAAQAELDTLAEVATRMEPQATAFESVRTGLRALKVVQSNDFGGAEEAGLDLRDMMKRMSDQGIGNPNFEVIRPLGPLIDGLYNYDTDAALALYDRYEQLLGMVPADHPMRAQMAGALSQMRQLLGQIAPGRVPTNGTTTVPQPPPVARSPIDEARHLNAVGMQRLATGMDSVERQTLAIDDLRRAATLSAGHPLHPLHLMSLGFGLMCRYETEPRPEDLSEAIDVFERARAEAGHEHNLVWTMCANPLAHAYRLAGRRELGRRTALEGLRGHAWNTLLQLRTHTDQFMSALAPEDAVDVARWCLLDGDSASAAAALDAGRAQRLYAAIEWRGVEDRLRAAGEPALAQRWRDALAGDATGVPADLRRDALNVLIGWSGEDGRQSLAQSSARILDPPSSHEIRAALIALNLDALVYLMPGDERFGAAVIVPAQDAISHVVLPDLKRETVSRMDARISALSRDLVQQPDHVAVDPPVLAEVCRWAWSGAIGPLVDRYLTVSSDRPLRLALVPMNELTRIPWHAALRVEDGRREYAIRRISFSYAPSARVLCETAWRSRVPLDDAGLVVADPATGGLAPDLVAARAEAQAIRQGFYPRARLLGRELDGSVCADGAGTVAEVRSWLADPGGGAMMHLAVHGEALGPAARDGQESSYLLLAGAPPGRFGAEEVIRALSLPGGRAVALAVLAGCRTGEPTSGYDEAFSIGTALLTAGVRTVISSQWSVPDNPTSIMMYLFHHYLRAEQLAPAVALREAQLAMIDKRLPDSLPAPLRARAGDDTSAILNWAGFFHAGH